MDRITESINLLSAVINTMENISVVGVDNQSKFVACAQAVQNVSQKLTNFFAEAQVSPADENKQEEVNGR